MGLSFKKIGKTITNTIKKPGNALKKVAVAATGAVTGFATGGPAGLVAGAVTGTIKASKTGKAPALNLRTGYQTVIAGGAAGFAAGAVTNAIKSGGGVKALTGKALGFAKRGGLATMLPGAIKKAGAFVGKAAAANTDVLRENLLGGGSFMDIPGVQEQIEGGIDELEKVAPTWVEKARARLKFGDPAAPPENGAAGNGSDLLVAGAALAALTLL